VRAGESGADTAAIWHDVECGAYTADLPLWLDLAREAGGPVLDVGAGTGRVALQLAAAGYEVVALDREAALLETLAERARRRDLQVRCVLADAAAFDLAGSCFKLVIVPMQTVQLLARQRRLDFLRCARRHLRPGGRMALAVAEGVEAFDSGDVTLPDPDRAHVDGWIYESQPVAVRRTGETMRLERERSAIAPDGRRRTETDVVHLALISGSELHAEARSAGLVPQPSLGIAPTPEHVGSEVVMLRA